MVWFSVREPSSMREAEHIGENLLALETGEMRRVWLDPTTLPLNGKVVLEVDTGEHFKLRQSVCTTTSKQSAPSPAT